MLKNEGFMRNNLVTNILLIVVAILLVLNLIPKSSPNSNRYSMYHHQEKDMIFKLDKETGRLFVVVLHPHLIKYGVAPWKVEYEFGIQYGGEFPDSLLYKHYYTKTTP